jgi:hypothetical protein
VGKEISAWLRGQAEGRKAEDGKNDAARDGEVAAGHQKACPKLM